MPRLKRSITGAAVACVSAALLAPAALGAATKPAVTTGAVANVAPASATLLGTVRPNEAVTTYNFQYGTTTKYTASTARTGAGRRTGAVAVAVDVAGLTPNTVYHYRLVARNAKGTVPGADRTFKTSPQPLGFSLAATPSTVSWGGSIVVSGVLAGTGTAGSRVVLQANPFPYALGFQPVGNPQVVNATGAFAFPILAVQQNTQYRTIVPNSPVVSPVVTANAALRVTIKSSARRVRRGRSLRLSGAVRPRRDGLRVAIQKLGTAGTWVTVGGTRTSKGSETFSTFAKRVRVRRGGQYRAFVEVTDGSLVSAASSPVRISSFTRGR